MNILVPLTQVIFRFAEEFLVCQQGLSSMDMVSQLLSYETIIFHRDVAEAFNLLGCYMAQLTIPSVSQFVCNFGLVENVQHSPKKETFLTFNAINRLTNL